MDTFFLFLFITVLNQCVLFHQEPIVAASSFVAPNASVVGNVALANNSSVWYNSVIRGDANTVDIGASTNVQDRSVISSTSGPVVIGERVTIGHGAVLCSCRVGSSTLIGNGAVIGPGARIGTGSIVAAGSVVEPDTFVPDGEIWAGNPAAMKRKVSAQDTQYYENNADHYVALAREHAYELS